MPTLARNNFDTTTGCTAVTGTLVVNTGALQGSTAGADESGYLTTAMTGVNHWAEVVVTTSAAATTVWSRLMVRFDGSAPFAETAYAARCNGGRDLQVLKIVAGAETSIGSVAGAFALGTTRRLFLGINGTTLTVKLDDANISGSPFTDATISTGTKIGLQTNASPAARDFRFESVEAGVFDVTTTANTFAGPRAGSAPTVEFSKSANVYAGLAAIQTAAATGNGYILSEDGFHILDETGSFAVVQEDFSAGGGGDFTVTSAAFVGAHLRAGATFDVSAVSRTLAGILGLSGGARPDVSAAGITEVGVLAQSGTARPEPNAQARVLAGTFTASSGARPDISAVSLTELGVHARSGPTADITATSLAEVGLLALSQPTSATDVSVPAMAQVGLFTNSGGARPEPNAQARVLAGILTDSIYRPDISTAVVAHLGVHTRSTLTAEITTTARALLGAVAASAPTVTISTTARILAGLLAIATSGAENPPGVACATLTAASAAGLLAAAEAIVTITAADGTYIMSAADAAALLAAAGITYTYSEDC
jgi:hypothetical protein